MPSSLPLSVMSNVAVLDCQHLSSTKSNKISTASEIKRNILDLSDEVPVDEGCLCGQVCGGVSGGSLRECGVEPRVFSTGVCMRERGNGPAGNRQR